MVDEQSLSLSPDLVPEDPSLAPPRVKASAEPPKVPLNVEEQAFVLAAANDDVARSDFADATVANVKALKEGKGKDLRAPIIEQEYASYINAMHDKAMTHAVIGEMEQTRQSLEIAYDLEQRAAKRGPLPDSAEHIVVSTRAVERAVSLDKDNLEVPVAQMQHRIDKYGELHGLRTSIIYLMEKEGDSPIIDGAAYIGTNFLPLLWYQYDLQFHTVAEKVTGKSIPYSLNPMGLVNAIRLRWEELDQNGKSTMLKAIDTAEYSMFGDNVKARNVFLNMIANYDSIQARRDMSLNALGLGADLFFGLGSLMSHVVRAGQPAKVLAETAGRKVVGAEIADAIAKRQLSILGMNDGEAVGKAIAAGKHPYSAIDPAAFEGASPHIYERLAQTWDRMMIAEEERMSAAGIPQAERNATLQALKDSYSPAARKDVYAVKFAGAPDGDVAKMTLLLSDEDGRLFRSQEAANAYARRRGFADDAWHLTTPEAEAALDATGSRELLRAFHGGDDFSEFRAAYVGKGQGGNSLGHGFYTSLVRDMAERFARGRATEGKVGTLYELNLPDQKWFLDFDKKWTAQSKEVKEALSRTLTADEIVALKGKTGRDVYDVLKNRLGNEAKASSALEKAGLTGNTGTTMGRDREFLVFSEDVMNKGVVQRTIVPATETAAEKVARKAAENADDASANALLREFGSPELDAVRMSVNQHKSFHEVPAFVNEQLVKNARNFDLPGKKIWEVGGHPAQFSGSYTVEGERYYKDFLRLIGLENERVLFITENDIPKLSSRVEFSSAEAQKLIAKIGDALGTRAEASYTALKGKATGKWYYILATKGDPTTIRGVKNLTHEIGHIFDHAYLKGLGVEQRNAMFDEFTQWLARSKKGGEYNIPAIMGRVLAPDMQQVDSLQMLSFLSRRETGPVTDQHYINWITDFHEYLAEQMSKWALTDERAVTVGEKIWADWAVRLRVFYKKIVDRMLQIFGKETLKMEPDAMFKAMMNEHVAGLQSVDNENVFRDLVKMSGQGESREMARAAKGKKAKAEPSAVEVAPVLPPERFLVKLNMEDPIKLGGSYDPTDIASMPWIAADPRHGVSADAMAGRVIGVHQTAKIRRDMTELLKPALAPLNKAERERVLAILEEGDQASFAGAYGREFTAPELLARDFTQKELEAYFTVRQSRMLNYFVHNKAMVDSMRRKGLMEIEVFGQNKMAGRPLTIEQAKAIGKVSVYDMSTKTFVALDAEKEYLSGKRLIEVAKGSVVDGQEVTRFLAGEKDATARTIHTALKYRPGEFARIYSDNYFIRMSANRVVDGVKQVTEYPIRTAATEKEAKEFIDAITKGRELVKVAAPAAEIEKVVGKFYGVEDFVHQVNEGELKDMVDMRFHFTREIDDYLGQTLEAYTHSGKLFTRDRGEHILTADRTRDARSNILNPYESLSREVTMVSHFATVNTWKEAQIDRWMNSFGDMLGSNRTGDNVRDFFAAAGAQFSHVTGKKGLFAERTHAYIMRQVGIQTQEHKWWQSLMRRVGEGTMPYVGEGIGAVIRDANPLNFIRSINHHFTLGLFNLSQLIVQANGMSIAAAIHPIYGAKAAAMYPAVRVALMSDNPEVWARISKVVGEDVGKLAASIRRSGLIDNLRSTSLHNIEDGKMDIFMSMPRRALSTAVDAGAFAFNRGEEAARIISFDIARREWEKLNPGGDFASKAATQWIMSKSDDYTMNMTRANLARWQEGVMSVPTQFLQYNIKLAQNIASGLISGGGKGRGFTRPEALKALAGSVAFYGAAGMGVSNMMGEWIPESVQEKMSPLTKTAIGQGIVAASFKAVVEATTGERFETAMGTRLGSINFFTDLVYNAFHDPKTIWEAMLGPSKSTGQRIAVLAEVANLWLKQPTVTLDDVGKGAFDFFSEQVSSARNLTKAYYISKGNNVLKNRKGEAIAELSNPEIWAQAVGLAPAAAYDSYQLIQTRRDHFKALDGVADMIFATQKKILEAYNTGDDARAKRMEGALQLMFPENYGDFVHVQSLVREKLAPYDTAFQKLMNEHAMKASNFSKPFTTTTPDVRK